MQLALLLQPVNKTRQILERVFDFGACCVHLLDVLFGVAKVVLPLLHIHFLLHLHQVRKQGFSLLLKDSHLGCIQQIESLLDILHLFRHIFVSA